MLQLHQKIKNARTAKDIKRTNLAKMIGVSYNALVKWETGTTMPTIKNLWKLAEALEAECCWLLCNKNDDET